MSLARSFAINLTVEKYFFYVFSLYLVLRAVIILSWASNLYLYEDTYLEWKSIASILETLISTNSILIILALFGSGYSVLYFDNAKFKTGFTYNTCTTFVFALLFSIIVAINLIVGIYTIVRLSSTVDDFKTAFMDYGYRWKDTYFVDKIQKRAYCCGINSYRDYKNILNIKIPSSCCFSSFEATCSEWQVSFRLGCAFRLSELFYSIYALSILTLVFSIAELFSLAFALHLVKMIKRKNAVKRQQTHVPPHIPPYVSPNVPPHVPPYVSPNVPPHVPPYVSPNVPPHVPPHMNNSNIIYPVYT